jgi:hypothetical protein
MTAIRISRSLTSNSNSWVAKLVLLLYSSALCSALHHSFYLKNDHRTVIGPVGVPFGFLKDGYYDLQVFDFQLNIDKHKYKPIKGQEDKKPLDVLNLYEPGFILLRFENEASFNQYMDELRANSTLCAFDAFLDDDDGYLDTLPEFDETNQDYNITGGMTAENGIFFSMRGWTKQQGKIGTDKPMREIKYRFKANEEGLYFLIYQICPTKASKNNFGVPPGIVSTYELDFHFINFDRWDHQSYLTAGEMHLPLLFFYFSVSYAFCFFWWVQNIRKVQAGRASGHGRPVIYAIHHIMSALLLTKTITILLKSIRYHYLRVSGHAEMWSFVYYTFAFLKGTFLFTVILLIGSGWSIVKPFLNQGEKRVILAILILQVINNLALVVLSRETEGESSFEGWTAVLHLVDILCCCAVLVPIVWQVNQLEKSVAVEDPDHPDYNGDGSEEGAAVAAAENSPGHSGSDMTDMAEKGRILQKLKLFRSFYLLVVAYVYSTRILVYLFATLLNYKHLWVRYFVIEVVTLTFYVITGYQFRPMVENPYLGLKKGEDEDDDEGDEDNFINERELEMRGM